MILKILVITSGGLLVYNKNLGKEDSIDSDLISGFLTAISNFAKEIKGGEIRALNFQHFKMVYTYDDHLKMMFVLVIDENDVEDEAREKVELLKNEFKSRFSDMMQDWNGETSVFKSLDSFVEDNIFLPPKILITGEKGVGKTTILDLFPGETILELDEDLNEIIQKPINVSGLGNLKQFVLREIDLKELIENAKFYRDFLNTVDVVCLVTNSAASNLGRTKKLLPRLKQKINNSDLYLLANFQDLKSTAFEPKKIEENFRIPTFGLSAISKNSKKQIYSIITQILKNSIM